MQTLVRRSPALRAVAIAVAALSIEWSRAVVSMQPGLAIGALVVGGAALLVTTWGYRPEDIGLGTSRLPFRILGGVALGAVLLLPAAARTAAVPHLPASLAIAAVVVSIGEEVAFRGALYTALDEFGGAPLAVVGSTLAWTGAHVLSHPPEFLGAVAAAGFLLALWRWACRDVLAPITGHVIADLAL